MIELRAVEDKEVRFLAYIVQLILIVCIEFRESRIACGNVVPAAVWNGAVLA